MGCALQLRLFQIRALNPDVREQALVAEVVCSGRSVRRHFADVPVHVSQVGQAQVLANGSQ